MELSCRPFAILYLCQHDVTRVWEKRVKKKGKMGRHALTSYQMPTTTTISISIYSPKKKRKKKCQYVRVYVQVLMFLTFDLLYPFINFGCPFLPTLLIGSSPKGNLAYPIPPSFKPQS